MKFIDPSYEVYNIPDCYDGNSVLRFLEKIGRVCYKSENKITESSAAEFLKARLNTKHWAMLEHYIFVFAVFEGIYNDIQNLKKEILNSSNDTWNLHEKMKYVEATYSDNCPEGMKYLVSGSATAFNYVWECKRFENDTTNGMMKVCHQLAVMYPDLMVNPWNHFIVSDPEIVPLSRDQIESLPADVRLIHDSMTVDFITDRGITHEIVRHRPASYAHESTRYVNYGKKGMTFIIPNWMNDHDHQILLDDSCSDKFDVDNPYKLEDTTVEWMNAAETTGNAYLRLLEMGWTPQQARSVLPNDIKTEIIMTARMGEWRHFFKMRADKPAHPQMKQLMRPLYIESSDKHPELFADIKELINLED